jgi:hypothetical protein
MIRKLRIKQFVYFLLLALVIWFFNHLSMPMTISTTVKARFSQAPDSLTLLSNKPFDIPVRISATGFRLLFTFSTKAPYEIPLSKMSYENGRYFVTPEYLESALQSSFSESITLVRASISRKEVDAALLFSKSLRVVPQVFTSFRPNFIAVDSVLIDPKYIQVRGVKSILDKYNEIYTIPIRLEDINESVNVEIALEKKNDDSLVYSSNSVRYSLKVIRFSENTFEVPITIRTKENSVKLLLFPSKVAVVCKAATERLKNLKADDFEVSVEYDLSSLNGANERLKLFLTRVPDGIFQVDLLTDSVDFIVEKQ